MIAQGVLRPRTSAWRVPSLLIAGLVIASVGPVAASPPVELAERQGEKVLASPATGPLEDWVRVLADKSGDPVAMQTAIVRYVRNQPNGSKPPLVVDLIAAIHVGDARYYDGLNKQFERYDALLYELVAPKGTVLQRDQKADNSHPVGALQNGMKSLLELEHQLERIDYTRSNFVHADMSPDQFAQSMKDRDENFLQMYFRLVGQSIALQSKQASKGQSSDIAIITAFFERDRARSLKIAFARQLEQMGSLLGAFGGEQGSTLITERNKTALAVLRQEINAGNRKLAIFYGGGHMSDMSQRLEKEFGMKRQSILWITAWDLAAP